MVELVELAHDGDRACIDYRKYNDTTTHNAAANTVATTDTVTDDDDDETAVAGDVYPQWGPECAFTPTVWSTFPANTFTDTAMLSRISISISISKHHQQDLTRCVGGFERSLPEIDEMADEVRRRFPRQAALRVSAAGLGGRVVVLCAAAVATAVVRFLEQAGWPCRMPQPGAPNEVLRAC